MKTVPSITVRADVPHATPSLACPGPLLAVGEGAVEPSADVVGLEGVRRRGSMARELESKGQCGQLKEQRPTCNLVLERTSLQHGRKTPAMLRKQILGK